MEDADEVRIRAARAEDEPEIRSCVRAAYERYVDRIGKPPAPMLDDYAGLIDSGVVRVIIRRDRVEGLIVMWSVDDHFHVDNIAVHPDAQGRGLGAALLADADAAARRSQRDEIRLCTNAAMVENIDYYPRHGFEETHRATDAGYERVYFSRRLE